MPTSDCRVPLLRAGLVLVFAGLLPPAMAWAVPTGPYHRSGPLQGSLRHDAPVPVYAPAARDSWNRVFHLLFTQEAPATLSRYYRDHDGVAVVAGDERPWVRTRRLVGGDIPEFYFGHEVRYLVEAHRFQALRQVLVGALREGLAARRTVRARILFQHDLWNRFDAVWSLLQRSPAAPAQDALDACERARAQVLLDLLGRMMVAVALDERKLAAVESNFPTAAAAWPHVLDPTLFGASGGWAELVPRRATIHSSTHGHRSVFRAFVRIPPDHGGLEGLQADLARMRSGAPGRLPGRALELPFLAPEGTRMLLVENPLALDGQGRLVPVPLLTLVESRRIRPLPLHPTLSDFAFDILHAPRRTLDASAPSRGGFVASPRDEPVPVNASLSSTRGEMLVPLATSCRTCHMKDGRGLGTLMFHGPGGVDAVHPGSNASARHVVEAKRQSPEYQALLRFFRKGPQPATRNP